MQPLTGRKLRFWVYPSVNASETSTRTTAVLFSSHRGRRWNSPPPLRLLTSLLLPAAMMFVHQLLSDKRRMFSQDQMLSYFSCDISTTVLLFGRLVLLWNFSYFWVLAASSSPIISYHNSVPFDFTSFEGEVGVVVRLKIFVGVRPGRGWWSFSPPLLFYFYSILCLVLS